MEHLKTIPILVISLFISTSFSFAQEITDPTEYGSLVFKSGFEGTSQVSSHPTSSKRQIITGIDGDYNWQDLSERLTKAELFYLVGDDNHEQYAEAKIDTGIGYNNSKGLLLETKKDDPSDSEQTRNEFWLYPDTQSNGVFSNQGFIRYKMKFDKNLNDVAWPSHWINFFETKQGVYPDRNYRFYLTVDKKASETKPKWVLTRDNIQSDKQFTLENKEIAVPIDEWMDVEIFWKKHNSEGRLFLSINGNVVFDFVGQTQHPTNPQHTDFFSPMKNYRSREWHEGSQTSKIWYDDLELWSGFPEDEILSFDAPQNIIPGETYSISTKIRSQSDRTIQLRLQNKDEDHKAYASLNFNVGKGTDTYAKRLTVDNSAPTGNTYQWLAVVTTLNGNWDNRIDAQANGNISASSTGANSINFNYWRVENKATGDWIKPTCNNVYNQTNALRVINTSNTGDCSMFKFIPTESDYYFMQNRFSKGRFRPKDCAADINDSVKIVQVSEETYGWCEQWKLVPVNNGYYRIENRQTKSWIRPQGCSTKDDTSVTQVGRSSTGDCTQWKLVDTNIRTN